MVTCVTMVLHQVEMAWRIPHFHISYSSSLTVRSRCVFAQRTKFALHTGLFSLPSNSSLMAACVSSHCVLGFTVDNGWAGVGYNNPNLNTPTLDHLAETGLKLQRHYVYKYCAPTRGTVAVRLDMRQQIVLSVVTISV